MTQDRRSPSSSLPPEDLLFWGKALPGSAAVHGWHPAVYHCLDVAAVAEALLVDGLSRPPPCWFDPHLIPSIAALVALHDIGKFSRPFQAKAPMYWPTSLGAVSRHVDPGHGAVGLALLCGVLEASTDLLLPSWKRGQRRALFDAICGHHGRPVILIDDLSDTIACAVCRNAAAAAAAAMLAVFDGPALPLPSADSLPAVIWWLAGFVTLADWIGSAETWFPYQAPTLAPAAYWRDVARPQAVAALAASGLMRQPPRPVLALDNLLGMEASASPVQVLATSLAMPAGPACILVEDQTGSGKTEAALLLAHRMMVDGRADGIFVALPTMATANAIYARLATAYRRLFADAATPSLALAHGQASLHPGFQASILDGAAFAAAPERPEDEPASAQCAAWIADDRRRAFLADVGVGTIDQALLAVLPTRHATLRLHGLHRRVLIVDEAHAYDAYMHAELKRLLTFHAGLGGSSVLLSATLPLSTRQHLADAHAEGLGCVASPLVEQHYPLVTVLGGGTSAELACRGREGLARSITVARLETFGEAIARIVAAAAAGAAVAWIRNSVDDAAAAHAALIDAGLDATLFHARFAMGDRQAIEAAVCRRYGKHGRQRAGIVVATQVLEQSLDLDFDVMVSDLAPMDLLIQRAGRLWRHDRPAGQRPVPGPCLLVLSPPPVADPPADWLGPELRRAGRVYGDHALLWRTARLLFEAGAIAAPGDVRRLVEEAYADVVPPGLRGSSNREVGAASAATSLARQNLLSWRNGYTLNAGAWDSDIRTPTRLGEDSLPFRLARWDDGRLLPWHVGQDALAWRLSEVRLPRRIASGVPPPHPAMAAPEAKVRRGWDPWSIDIPIIALSARGDRWHGVVLRNESVENVSYSSRGGLRVP